MSTGRFIFLSVTSAITFDAHIATVLCSLVFLQFLNVSVISSSSIFTDASALHLATNETRDDADFRKFRRQLLHSSLAKILESLKPGMTTPEVVRFPDGHFRKVIYGLGPYIADYPEQALLACIVQGWCPKYVIVYLPIMYITDKPFRCTAPAKDLDSGQYGRRSQAHAEVLVEEFELGMLWDEYGLVGDIVVRHLFLVPHILYPCL